jgi:hypothetical protein
VESGYFVVVADQKRVRSLRVRCSLRCARSGVHHSFRLLHTRWRWLAATATGAAASESVNIDEVDAYALIAGQRADHRTESSCGAA